MKKIVKTLRVAYYDQRVELNNNYGKSFFIARTSISLMELMDGGYRVVNSNSSTISSSHKFYNLVQAEECYAKHILEAEAQQQHESYGDKT